MSDLPSALRLAFNPFEPAASGPPVGGVPFGPPAPLEARIRRVVDQLVNARGTRAVVIIGDYGSGKTCLLRWLQNQLLPEHRIQPFYFDNPGVHFYNLANTLLRAIGRKDFAKFIWELAGTHVQAPYQGNLFRTSFEEYLAAESRRGAGTGPTLPWDSSRPFSPPASRQMARSRTASPESSPTRCESPTSNTVTSCREAPAAW